MRFFLKNSLLVINDAQVLSAEEFLQKYSHTLSTQDYILQTYHEIRGRKGIKRTFKAVVFRIVEVGEKVIPLKKT